jgi:hypothetical protein
LFQQSASVPVPVPVPVRVRVPVQSATVLFHHPMSVLVQSAMATAFHHSQLAQAQEFQHPQSAPFRPC